MQNRVFVRWSATAWLILFSSSLFAHHSDSVFDQEKLVTITGNVTKFEFSNPHTRIHMDVEDKNGKVEPWVLTGGALGSMRIVGWTSRTIQRGEKLTVSGFQYWDGQKIMIHVDITRENGEKVIDCESSQRRIAGFLHRAGAKSIAELAPNFHVRLN